MIHGQITNETSLPSQTRTARPNNGGLAVFKPCPAVYHISIKEEKLFLSVETAMGDTEIRDRRQRAAEVRAILRKKMQLTLKQEKFCNDECVARFLRAKNDNVMKAAKQLSTSLAWRDANGIDRLSEDEFASGLAEGVAYVAGQDDEARPVMVFRMKQEDRKLRSRNCWVRLLVFTVEVSLSSMSKQVDQFVLIFDARGFRSAPAFFNLFMATLKIVSDNYPGRLHRAFAVDPPPVFLLLWKAARPFLDLWTSTTVIASLKTLEREGLLEKEEEEERSFSAADLRMPRSSSLRFDPSPRFGEGSSSSRFSFTVSRGDSLKPWYLTTSPSLGAANGERCMAALPRRRQAAVQSPAAKFSPFLKLYRRPYDEVAYRAKLRLRYGGFFSPLPVRKTV
ncbi:uncharacterized protein LOC144701997 [Wolffia australiana]